MWLKDLCKTKAPFRSFVSLRSCDRTNKINSKRWHLNEKMLSKPKIRKELQMENFPKHRVPQEIIGIEEGSMPSDSLQRKLELWASNKSSMRENEQNYMESFRTMIDFEDAAGFVQLQKCNQENVKLYHVDGNEFFFLVEPKMQVLCTHVNQFDLFDLYSNDGRIVSDGEVSLKENDKIYIELNKKLTDWHEDKTYDILFRNVRKSHLVQHQALNYFKKHKLFDLLINNPKYRTANHIQSETHHTKSNEINGNKELISDIDDLNAEQIEAVEKIVNANYYPLPYLLFGPPGTGKTKTLAAAVENIVRTTDKHVLVCAQSNSACNEIVNRLGNVLNRDEMLRIFSVKKDPDEIENSVKYFSNFYGGELKLPPLRTIYKYRVVIATLAMAGCLTRAQCDPDHFSYVIIDECASALEPMALVPIAGLCTSVNKVHANIILTGDPKQLDAVTKSRWATNLGFGTSFLEQLFYLPLYQRDMISRKFNSEFITQLVKNYRSHPAILEVPNQLFYEGALEAKRSPTIDDLNVQVPQLNRNCPLVFKSVQGRCIKPENDTSSYNVEEIHEIMNYVRKLLTNGSKIQQTDIGIVSPYRLQCEMIRVSLKSIGFGEITVGTAEKFQGQERKVIIASTVCSRNGNLSTFVSDPQRFNVMVTRAQYLLIVVGDPHTLNEDSNWSEFIKFCYINNCLIQSDNQFVPN